MRIFFLVRLTLYRYSDKMDLIPCYPKDSSMTHLRRTLAHTLIQATAQFPVLLLTGPRQVGKSTLLEDCAEAGRKQVTLDDMEQRALAQNDPALFLKTWPAPVIIDEVQACFIRSNSKKPQHPVCGLLTTSLYCNVWINP